MVVFRALCHLLHLVIQPLGDVEDAVQEDFGGDCCVFHIGFSSNVDSYDLTDSVVILPCGLVRFQIRKRYLLVALKTNSILRRIYEGVIHNVLKSNDLSSDQLPDFTVTLHTAVNAPSFVVTVIVALPTPTAVTVPF